MILILIETKVLSWVHVGCLLLLLAICTLRPFLSTGLILFVERSFGRDDNVILIFAFFVLLGLIVRLSAVEGSLKHCQHLCRVLDLYSMPCRTDLSVELLRCLVGRCILCRENLGTVAQQGSLISNILSRLRDWGCFFDHRLLDNLWYDFRRVLAPLLLLTLEKGSDSHTQTFVGLALGAIQGRVLTNGAFLGEVKRTYCEGQLSIPMFARVVVEISLHGVQMD